MRWVARRIFIERVERKEKIVLVLFLANFCMLNNSGPEYVCWWYWWQNKILSFVVVRSWNLCKPGFRSKIEHSSLWSTARSDKFFSLSFWRLNFDSERILHSQVSRKHHVQVISLCPSNSLQSFCSVPNLNL